MKQRVVDIDCDAASARELGRVVHAHPTLSEALMEAAQAAAGQATH